MHDTIEMRLKVAKRQLRELKKHVKAVEEQRRVAEARQKAGEEYFRGLLNKKEAELSDKSDHALPQKQALLKELAYLVQATSRAVRTTMWSMAPEKRRGF